MTRLPRIALVAIFGALPFAALASASPRVAPLVIAVPGPLTGCDALHPNVSESNQLLLDLTRPSAFVTSVQGSLRGEGGAILSAELASLNPQVVTYSLDTSLRWSNGRHFSSADLIAWWRRGRSADTVQSAGYRDITSMVASNKGSVVTATFATPFAAWPLLFRDVGQSHAAALTCSLSQLLHEPSLGPYRLESLTSNHAVLVSNARWTASFNRLPRVVLTTSEVVPTEPGVYAAYYPSISAALLNTLSNHPTFASHIGATDAIEELQFAPHRPLTNTASLRHAWSDFIDRTSLLRSLYGDITLTPLAATSTLFAQNEFGSALTTTTTADSGGACLSCARGLLKAAGLDEQAGRWYERGQQVSLTLVVGPSATDASTATRIATQWRHYGLRVNITTTKTEQAASHAVATNGADVAVFERPVGVSPWLASSGALRMRQSDAYSLGVAVPSVITADAAALADFNPVTAAAKWSVVDQALRDTGYIFPLFTPPSVTAWTTNVQNIAPSLSELGLLDQITNWGTTQG